MSPLVTSIFILSLGLGTILTFSSSHWLIAWMGLEINTLAIIPLITKHHHPRATEAATKYFITQATGAALILFASIINAIITSQWDIYFTLHPVPASFIILALALKLGVAPVHAWFPEVLQGVSLSTGLILSTWQKLAPFAILYQIIPSSPHIMTSLALISILVGGWGGINQTQLRKVMAYSSIAHLGWITLIIQLNQNLALLALMIYIPITLTIFMIFIKTTSLSLNSLAISWSKFTIFPIIAPFVFFSLAGLPPLSGFLPKWLIIEELTKQNISLIAVVAALSSLLSLYFYLQLTYTLSITISPNISTAHTYWRPTSPKLMVPTALAFTLSTMAIPLLPLTLALLPF